MEKRFDEWNELKKKINLNSKLITYHERDIWWYAAGENIGSEINGKGRRFSRPILVVRKYGATTFLGVPLSTKNLSGPWYSIINVNNVTRCALLSQVSSYSAFRLYNKIDRLSETEFKNICHKLKILLFKEKPSGHFFPEG
ncbi:type II toxin-antitoxin system PemK/MazF family toxin [Candidatus Saccharibacteria bacterium]|nr:type II toxin-antitoxin system PemK/MazF family toxin [Candidatus Saccharibacteria bacterium]